MNGISFVTLQLPGTNIDLLKDGGQIPYTLCRCYKIDATIVACHIDNTANVEQVAGLKVKHFPLIINYTISGILFLLLHSKKIDWLNIYFAGRQALIWMKLYKFLNRKGRVYLKLDMDYRSCDLYDSHPRERIVFKKNTEIADIVSAESKEIIKRIQKYSKKEILLMEDGIFKLPSRPNVECDKANIFITVGRLGTYQKATDILLEAFAKSANRHSWNLILIGNVEEDFKPYITEYFDKYPMLIDRVIFKGSINDREKLYQEYYDSKVFVLPSRWESFGIVSGEALCCGCYLILSDSIPPANAMTAYGKYGDIVKTGDVDSLSEAFVKATYKEYGSEEIKEIQSYANNLFSWERICSILYTEMRRIDNEKNN